MSRRFCECGCKCRVNTCTARFILGHNGNITRNGATVLGHKTPEYRSYTAAKSRCNNPKCIAWKHYGGRGIKFLFTSFEEFFIELGPRPEGKSLDRKDNDGNYEPGNVKWSTQREQMLNRRTFIRGKCMVLSSFSIEELEAEILVRKSSKSQSVITSAQL